jgi:hypothetical protein
VTGVRQQRHKRAAVGTPARSGLAAGTAPVDSRRCHVRESLSRDRTRCPQCRFGQASVVPQAVRHIGGKGSYLTLRAFMPREDEDGHHKVAGPQQHALIPDIRFVAHTGQWHLESASRQPTKQVTLPRAKAKLGAAYTLRVGLDRPGEARRLDAGKLEPFTALTRSEVAVLPARIQFNVPTINCAQIVDPETTPPTVAPPTEQIVTRDPDTVPGPRTKYLLSRAQLTNADIASATPTNTPALGWALTVRLTGAGQQRWTWPRNSAPQPAPKAPSTTSWRSWPTARFSPRRRSRPSAHR